MLNANNTVYNSTDEEDDGSEDKNIPVVVMFSFFVVLGVFGNSLILYIYGFRFKESTTRVFILSLAIFDLITCVLLPYKIVLLQYGYIFNNPNFSRMEIIRVYFLQVSVMILPLVSVDRYRRICRPFRKQISPRIAKVMVLVTCVVLGLVTITRLAVSSEHSGNYTAQAFVSTKYVNQKFNGTGIGSFYFVFTIMPFCIPIPVMIVMYFLIGLKVRVLVKDSTLVSKHGSSGQTENISEGTIIDNVDASEGEIIDNEGDSEGEIVDNEGASEGEIVDNEGAFECEIIDNECASEGEIVGNEGAFEGEIIDNEGASEGEIVDNEGAFECEIIDNKGASEDEIIDNEGVSEDEIIDKEDTNGKMCPDFARCASDRSALACDESAKRADPKFKDEELVELHAADDETTSASCNDKDFVQTAVTVIQKTSGCVDQVRGPSMELVQAKEVKNSMNASKKVFWVKARVSLGRFLKTKNPADDRRTSMELDLHTRRKHEPALPWKRVTLIFFLITIVYIVSFLPFFILFTIFRVNQSLANHVLSHAIFIVVYNFPYVTNISNCFLYGFFDPRFRRELRSFKSSVSSSIHISSKGSA